jgi:hypothetical protein
MAAGGGAGRRRGDDDDDDDNPRRTGRRDDTPATRRPATSVPPHVLATGGYFGAQEYVAGRDASPLRGWMGPSADAFYDWANVACAQMRAALIAFQQELQAFMRQDSELERLRAENARLRQENADQQALIDAMTARDDDDLGAECQNLSNQLNGCVSWNFD